jgi:3',5'-nucleoside bisphosphate phosphatase
MFNTLSANFDLHNHTNASDGILSADALLRLAAENGCEALAITDHDSLDSVRPAIVAAKEVGLRFIAGVEISVSWIAAGDIDSPSKTIHIVGLNIDPDSVALNDGLAHVRGGRLARGRAISASLEDAGIPSTFEEAHALAENKAMLGRTHFARALVARGVVHNVGQAFQRYLTPGHPGYVPHRWASLADAVAWIRAAGGEAVIAHPGRYNLGEKPLKALFSEFKDLGGSAIEVVTGSHSPKEYAPFAARCNEFGFFASRGADFHGIAETPHAPGTLPTLDKIDCNLRAVWERF